MSQKYVYGQRLAKPNTRTTPPNTQSSAVFSKHTNILQLQRTIGNQAVNSLVNITPAQKKIQRTGYERLDGSSIITGDVQEGNNTITMTGSLRRDNENVDNIVAHLDYHPQQFPMSKVDDGFFSQFRNIDTLEITIVDASPRRRRIGQLLSYHLALVAQTQGIEYITAQNVTAAREPFYNPLGFRDAVDGPSWQGLKDEKQQIEDQIRLNPPNMPQLLSRHQEISQLLANNMIFIRTADLLQNAYDVFSAEWFRV